MVNGHNYFVSLLQQNYSSVFKAVWWGTNVMDWSRNHWCFQWMLTLIVILNVITIYFSQVRCLNTLKVVLFDCTVLRRRHDQIRAFSAYCSHYWTPLIWTIAHNYSWKYCRHENLIVKDTAITTWATECELFKLLKQITWALCLKIIN